MLTRVLALNLGPYNIRANAIAPGLVRTEFSRPDWEDSKYLDPYVAGVPLGRVAEATDMVGAALLLASSASSYISGTSIIVDGGGQA
jgi:NAD(P)-dependent dehydrogenase (short-subunit alcohol dehydrogenase family)